MPRIYNCTFFNYPDVIINEVFTNWIKIKDFCAVDSAFSNIYQRHCFEGLIKCDEFTQKGIKFEGNYSQIGFLFLKWIYLRGLKLHSVYLDVQNKEEFTLLCKINLSRTKKLKLLHYEPQEGSLFPLIDACVRLEQLVLKNCKISDSIVYFFMPSHLNKLKHLKLYSYCSSFTMDAISSVANKCVSLERIVLIYGNCNGDSQYIDVNDSLSRLVQNNCNLKHIEIDLIDGKIQNNNTNLTFIRDIAGRCVNLIDCELKYYGKLDISYLTSFIKYQKAINNFDLEVTDPEDGVICHYQFCAINDKKEVLISDHIITDDHKFENLFREIQWADIVLKDNMSISDNVIILIAFHSNNVLKSIIIDNCGSKWSTESFIRLIINCVNLECITLSEFHQLDFNDIVKIIKQKNILQCLVKLCLVCSTELITSQLLQILINSKRLVDVYVSECHNVDYTELSLFLLKNNPELEISVNVYSLHAFKHGTV
jgi:hypothetical protein